MVQYELCWPTGSASTGRVPQQLTESPFKYINLFSANLNPIINVDPVDRPINVQLLGIQCQCFFLI